MPTTYPKNFLKEVILKVEYDKVSNFVGLVNSFAERYPVHYRQQVPQKDIIINGSSLQLNDNTLDVYVYETEDSSVRVELCDNNIVILYRKYSNKDQLTQDLEFVDAYIRSIGITELRKIGLRYINIIENREGLNIVNYDEFQSYISESIAGGLHFASTVGDECKLLRSMTEMVMNCDDIEANITFKYGVWNNDFPRLSNKKEFILDYDCVSMFPIELSQGALVSKVGGYNDKIYAFFESSIKQELKDIMVDNSLDS